MMALWPHWCSHSWWDNDPLTSDYKWDHRVQPPTQVGDWAGTRAWGGQGHAVAGYVAGVTMLLLCFSVLAWLVVGGWCSIMLLIQYRGDWLVDLVCFRAPCRAPYSQPG